MSQFILVHGSWHGAWCWRELTPLLRNAGHQVAAVDLPGHGQDKTPPGEITLDHYVDRVAKALEESKPAVVVGHSMGGVVISQLAEKMWHEVKQLIFLSAFMPGNGKSMFDWAGQDAESLPCRNGQGASSFPSRLHRFSKSWNFPMRDTASCTATTSGAHRIMR